MGTFLKETKHPVKEVWEEAIWYCDFYEEGHYGVVFPSDVKRHQSKERNMLIAFDPEGITLETRESQSKISTLPRTYNKKSIMAKSMKSPSRTKMPAMAQKKSSGGKKVAVKQGQGYAKGGKGKSAK